MVFKLKDLTMIKIGIITGSTRPGRNSEAVAKWVYEKAAGFVSYGSMGGVRAVEQLRLIMGELQVADVRSQVALSLFTDFENYSVFKPAPQHEASINTMINQVIAWGNALKAVRK